ncbi:MAG: transposase [Thaumarchaeota archaeon]|nr:transposase [Nitrososphaerota archaeon]
MITYKFRFYPTTAQENVLVDTLETCRRLYNAMLADRIENRTGFYEQKKTLTQVRKQCKHLQAVHSQVLQDVVLRLDKAYQAFFAGLARHPRFKRRTKYNSFTYPQTGFKMKDNRLRLSKIGQMKVTVHRSVVGVIKRVTLIKDINQWFVAILTDGEANRIEARKGQIGVDFGVTNFVALSDGTTTESPRFMKRSAGPLRMFQRALSRKRSGSKNREKARIALAKAYRKVRRQREDFAHKLSDRLTKENRLIVFEDLKVGNMAKNNSLASAIMDASWGQLRRMTAYKAERRGGRVISVDPNGTSQKCSRCGAVVRKELSLRTHACPRCGLTIDRDVNAAQNILKAGLEQARVEESPLLVQRRRISKFAPMKREARDLSHG